MTVAVCLKCGTMKCGAFTPCSECGFDPETDEERAKHLMVTDWYFAEEDLKGIAEKIQAGEEVTFDPQSLASFIAYVKGEEEGNSEKKR
jgi:hypothetical protein